MDDGSKHAGAEVAALRELLRADPHNPALLRHCAREAAVLRDYGAALQFALSALEIAPEDAEAKFHEASALIGLRRYAEAIRCLQALRSAGLEEQGIDTNLALCHYARGEFGAARPLLEALMAAGSESPDVLRLAVSTLHHLGDLSEAIAFADAHPTAGQDGALAGVYALAYLDAERTAEASRYAALALAGNPDSVDGLTVQATLAVADLNFIAAEKQFRRILELAPATGRAWVGLGILSLLAYDLPGATAHLERGVAAMPGHVGSWQVLGWAYLVAGELDSAERAFKHALDMDRNFAESHGAMASLHALRGQVTEAQAQIALAERLDRNGLAARFAAAVLAGAAGDPAAGQALIRKTVAGLVPRLGTRAASLLVSAARSPAGARH